MRILFNLNDVQKSAGHLASKMNAINNVIVSCRVEHSTTAIK